MQEYTSKLIQLGQDIKGMTLKVRDFVCRSANATDLRFKTDQVCNSHFIVSELDMIHVNCFHSTAVTLPLVIV